MKQLTVLLLAICSVVHIASAQEPTSIKAREIVHDHHLDITWHKTTVIIFPAPITDADRGDTYVLAERAEGVENVLKVKAGERDFKQSNLHVVTADGKVYAFTVNYSDHPDSFTIDMGKQYPHSPVTFDGVSLNSNDIELAVATIRGIPTFIRRARKSKYGMELRLEGIFVKDDVLFFRYNLKNSTQIRYDAMIPRFYIRDKKQTRRTAVQHTSVEPLFIRYGGSPEATGGRTLVVGFPKFTIAESKHFVAEVMELGGDRNLECRIDQKKLLLARALD